MSLEFRVRRFKTKNSELRTHYSELVLVILGEHDRKGGSLSQFTFDLDLSPMEFDNFLDQGETNPQPLGVSKGFCFFLEMARETFLQRLMGDSNPCVGNSGEDEFRILLKAHTDLSSLTVIFDGIGKKIIEKLVELIFDAGDLCGFGKELSFQF